MRTVLNRYIGAGSDSNNGESAGSPWATFQHSYDWIQDNVDFRVSTVTVHVAAGTYAPFTAHGRCLGQKTTNDIIYDGNTSDCWSVVISGTNCNAITVDYDAMFYMQGISPQATGSIPYGFGIVVGTGRVNFGIMGWKNCQRGYIDVGCTGGIVTCLADQAIMGSSGCFAVAEAGGRIFLNGRTLYTYGALNFSEAFLLSDEGSLVDCSGVSTIQTNGPCTGTQAIASDASVIKIGTSILPCSGWISGSGGQIN